MRGSAASFTRSLDPRTGSNTVKDDLVLGPFFVPSIFPQMSIITQSTQDSTSRAKIFVGHLDFPGEDGDVSKEYEIGSFLQATETADVDIDPLP